MSTAPISSTPDIVLAEGDELPLTEKTLIDSEGAPIDLSDVSAVALRYRKRNAAGVASKAGSIVGAPSAGRVRVTWSAGDLDTPGDYSCHFLLTRTDGRTLRVPNGRQMWMRISADL